MLPYSAYGPIWSWLNRLNSPIDAVAACRAALCSLCTTFLILLHKKVLPSLCHLLWSPYLRGRCLLGRHPALRPQHRPSAHPDRPQGRQNLFEPLANLRRRSQWISLSVSNGRVKSLSSSFRRSIKALHWAMRCTAVSSSSWQRGQPESCRIPIIQRCWLRSAWPVRSEV